MGADYGSSVDWFLEHGARRVIAFEADPALEAELRERFRGNNSVQVNGTWTGQEFYGEIFKIDCEGCEQRLSTQYLDRFLAFAVALHPDWLSTMKYEELRGFMLKRGARLIQNLGKEEMWIAC